MKYTIHCDSEVEAEWFVSLAYKALSKASVHKIAKRGQNPPGIESLVSYDRPDIILSLDDKPVLVLEKTREVPTGHNVGQRFARLARAAELGVPSIYFMPFEARKHGTFENLCQMNPRLLMALIRMSKLHNTPAVCFNWRADQNGELIHDGTEDQSLSLAVKGFIEDKCCAGSRHLKAPLADMVKELKVRTEARASYLLPPKSIEAGEHSSTSLRGSSVKRLSESPIRRDRTRSLVYVIGMLPASCRRQDPYTGMQFVYDYAYCRSGPSRVNRTMNLVLKFPHLNSSTFISNNPNDKNSKSCNWYLLADGFEFSDKFVLNDE